MGVSGYFAGLRMTVGKCIILDYYVVQFLNVQLPTGSLAQWSTRGRSCSRLRI